MSQIQVERILVGVTGGIAAYKAAEVVRLLKKQGHDVRVVMTESGKAFVTPMTFQALTGHPVRERLFDESHEAAMGHIELARWATRVLIAPASANTLAKIAHGLADDLLSTLVLATTAPVYVAPAMNAQMWDKPVTRANITALTAQGIRVIGPDCGEQACGELGFGRMSEPEAVVAALMADAVTTQAQWLAGLRIAVTAGPTREPIDPVRYLSNRSSGKMGYAIASAARALGADVHLISGPVVLPTPTGVQRSDVLTAEDMRRKVLDVAPNVDILIAAAAVSDYRPVETRVLKLKRRQGHFNLEMIGNPDILKQVTALSNAPFSVGFAAETHDMLENAREKLLRKGVDMVIANDVNEGKGFDVDVNTCTVIYDDEIVPLQTKAKSMLAYDILALIKKVYDEKH